MTLELRTEDRLVYQFYPVVSNFITFTIKAPHDAHIALTSTPYECNPMYEVFFGGWKNTKSVIRKNQRQPDVVEVQTPNILDAYTFRKFWIRWEYGTITAGVGNNSQPLMTWQDNESFPKIQYFGVCTGWGAQGHWIIENSTPGLYPQAHGPTPGYSLSTFGANVGFNPQAFPTNAPKWIPSSNGSIPPNAVIGGNDANGEQLFVVRARHEGALIPGKLVPSHRVAYVAWGGNENPKSDYEVLCDCFPRWVPAVGQQIPPGAFPGGQTESGETLYIGRSQHEGSTTVGKVQISHGVCYIPFGGKEVAKKHYEILTI